MPLMRPTFSGLRRERVAASAQFHDGRFHNTRGLGAGLREHEDPPSVREFLFGDGRRTPTNPLPALDPNPLWAAKGGRPDSGLRATWLGHSTLLIEIEGLRVLTDPVWAPRAAPSRFVGPKRFQPVPVTIDALPRIDAIILSHDHYDHLDRRGILALARRFPDLRIYTSLGVGARLEAWGLPAARVVELDWWERARLEVRDERGKLRALEICAAPSQHFSGRTLSDRNLTLWSSFTVLGETRSVFFSGDTGLTTAYREIAERLGPFDLVALEIGAYHPSWGDIHLGPDNALVALEYLGGGCLLPVHWGTFRLATHDWDQPAERLLERAPDSDLALLMPKLGLPVEPAHVDRADRLDPWWRAVSGLESSLDPHLSPT